MASARMIRTRYDGSCETCGRAIVATSQAWWDSSTKTLRCPPCGSSDGPEPLIAVEPTESGAVTARGAGPNVAGRSAQEKFDRLHAERVRRVRKRHPRIGGALLAIFDDEQSTQAWAKGAVGERRVGQKLDELRPSGVVALHDLRVPGKRSNIDHIAVAPSGVWVIDAKRYENKEVTRKDVGGLFKHDLRLYVGGRDENKLVEDVLAQADVVRRELGGGWPDVPIRPALCFVDGSWPLFPRPFEVQGVRVLWSKRVAQEVGQPGPLSAEMARHIARRLAESLTPA